MIIYDIQHTMYKYIVGLILYSQRSLRISLGTLRLKYAYIIIITIICSSQFSIGQTYIGPILGYDFARIQGNPNGIYFDDLHTTQTGYRIKNPVFGIKLEQYLFPFLYFSFQSTYTHKYIPAYTSQEGLLPVFGVKFNFFQQYLSIRFLIAHRIYIGGGLNYNFINKIRWDNGLKNDPSSNFTDHDKGLHISTGVKLYNFDLELYCYKSSSHFTNDMLGILNLDPITSFGLNISYDLKVFNKIKLFDKKGQSCPTF